MAEPQSPTSPACQSDFGHTGVAEAGGFAFLVEHHQEVLQLKNWVMAPDRLHSMLIPREDSLRWACGRPESRFGGVVIWTMSLMFCAGAQPVVQTVQYSDLTPAVQRMLHTADVDA